MTINFGACRAIGVRTAQIMAYTMIALNWLGIPPGFWSFLILGGVAVFWPIFDYRVVWPQEQAFALKKNAEFQKLVGAVESNWGSNRPEL